MASPCKCWRPDTKTHNGPVFLLLHGLPDLAYSWRKVMLVLVAAGYHVLAPDQRGYGRIPAGAPTTTPACIPSV